MYVGREVFAAITDRETAKQVFAKAVQRVEVETHSYCNRRCNYCPNEVGDRLGENKRMTKAHWQLILANLREIDYAQNLVLQSYNEPLADRAIVERIREAKEALPKARILIYTNGDYLDREYLDSLSQAGLDYMHVSIHTRHDGTYSDVDALNLIAKLVRRLGYPIRYSQMLSQQVIVARIPHPRIDIEVRSINYNLHGNDRAGVVTVVKKPPPRKAPCHFPFAHFYVGFNGNITPCCHVRGDLSSMSNYLYGNLDGFASIFQAWAGHTAAQWRKQLISPLIKQAPCTTCSAPFLDGSQKAQEQAKDIYWKLVELGLLLST